MKKIILYILIFSLSLNAKLLISPIDAMKQSFGENSEISKKNILVSKSQIKIIEQDAKAKTTTKIFRVFKAKIDDKILGYGIILKRKIRTKSAVILYIISNDGVLKSIDIIAFNEPLEYIPSKTWIKQFNELPTNKMLKVSQDIPTITGATMSARSIVDASRIAFAFYKEIIKKDKL